MYIYIYFFLELEIDGLKGNQLPPPDTGYIKQFHKCGEPNICPVSTYAIITYCSS